MKIVNFSLFECFKDLRKKMGISKEKIIPKSSNNNFNNYNKSTENTIINKTVTKEESIIKTQNSTYNINSQNKNSNFNNYSKPIEKNIIKKNTQITKNETKKSAYNSYSNSGYSNVQTKNITIDIPSFRIKEIANILKNSYGQISCDENGVPLSINFGSIENLNYYYMYNYFPRNRYGYRDDQDLVYNLKDGIDIEENAYLISKGLLKCFNNLSEYTIVPIAASNTDKTERRYKKLLEIICKNTGLKNGYYAIRVLTETQAKHLTGKETDLSSHIQIDSSLIKTNKIIIFDDVITKGKSIKNMKALLEKEKKSFVVTAFLFAKTTHHI